MVLGADRSSVAEALLRAVLANSADVVVCLGTDRTVRWVTPAFETVFGRPVGDVVGRRIELFTPASRDQALAAFRDAALAGVDSYAFRGEAVHGDGSVRSVDVRVSLLRDETGDVDTVVARLHDVTERLRLEARVAESEANYRMIAENSADIVFRGSPAAVMEWISPSVTDALGYRPDEMVGRPIAEFLHPEDLAPMRNASAALNRGERAFYQARLRSATGAWRWTEVAARPVRNDDGTIIGRIGNARDVHAEVLARQALAQSEERFRTAMYAAPAGMAVLDLDRRCIEVNPALARMIGREPGWLLGRVLSEVMTPADAIADAQLRADALVTGAPAGGETRLIGANGEAITVEHAVSVIHDTDGRPQGYVSQFLDTTVITQTRAALVFEATHDTLTRLANRRALFDAAESTSTHVLRTGTRNGFLYIDIDGLKPINDTHGHAAGDHVLVETAARLKAQVRSDDVVARFGGDEFVVLLRGLHTIDNAVAVAAKMHAAAQHPLTFHGHELRVTLSIGVALIEHGERTDEALRHADAALYRAKQTGRARTVTHPATA